jgi:hypothetical protein
MQNVRKKIHIIGNKSFFRKGKFRNYLDLEVKKKRLQNS